MAKRKPKAVKKVEEHVAPVERSEPLRHFLGETFQEDAGCRCEPEFVLKLRNAGRRVIRDVRHD